MKITDIRANIALSGHQVGQRWRFAMSIRLWFTWTGVACLLAHADIASAGHPFRGAAHWTVLLCQYSDSATPPPKSVNDMEDMLVRTGTGGLADYYTAVTRGSVSMSGSSVRGWFTIPMTIDSVRAFSHGGAGGDRNRSFQLCVDAAHAAGFTPPQGDFVAVVTNPEVDLWGGGGGRAFLGANHELAAYGHEISHGLGLNHSHSESVSAPCGGALSEYHDAFDMMSWACETQSTPTAHFGFGGPAFNAFHLDRMGWLGRSEILTFGADGATSATVTLTALYRFGFGGTRLVRVPYDPADPNRYFTVELRMPTGWDAGFGSPVVLIHDSKIEQGEHRSFLLRASVDGPPEQRLIRNQVIIMVQSIDAAAGTARVQISSPMAERCLPGFVWREAGVDDIVCVTGQSRSTVRSENTLGASRRRPDGSCVQGFVWREAFSSDHVCVPGTARTRVRDENSLAASRANPARFAFGPNACKPGYVWREADDRDWVCVPPSTRAETRQENALAASRRVGSTNTCAQGFVWREAYPVDDKTCVLGSSRARARLDNEAADSRRAAF
jgi:hypothetical protein